MPPGVLAFVMNGCPACHEYVPRLGRVSARYRARGMPVRVLDINADKRAAALADKLGVKATPTTIAQTLRGTTLRRVGAIADSEIEKLLASVITGAR